MRKTPAKILFLDIENTPSLGWTWGPKWDTNILEFEADWHLLSFAWKWADASKVHVKGLCDYPGYAQNLQNDKLLVEHLWRLLDQADVVIGHNVDRFDIRKINTRFLTHGLRPPSPYKTVDTLKVAKKYFRFDSNKLDDLGRCLGLGRKLVHTGFDLWISCMQGSPKAWRMMKSYNQRDVSLLEEVYYELLAWVGNHPNVNKGGTACPKCSSQSVQKRGFSFTQSRRKQRYQCTDCGGWFEGPAAKEAKHA